MVSPSSILSGGMNAMRKELNSVGRVAKQFTLPLLVLCAAMAIAAPPLAPPFGAWTRLSPDPIVSPRGDRFESDGTFNPAVLKEGGKFLREADYTAKWSRAVAMVPTHFHECAFIGLDPDWSCEGVLNESRPSGCNPECSVNRRTWFHCVLPSIRLVDPSQVIHFSWRIKGRSLSIDFVEVPVYGDFEERVYGGGGADSSLVV